MLFGTPPNSLKQKVRHSFREFALPKAAVYTSRCNYPAGFFTIAYLKPKNSADFDLLAIIHIQVKTALLSFHSLFLVLFVGCGKSNDLNCLLNGDNIFGRFTFANNGHIVDGADIRAEWSTDNFQTVGGGSSFYNLHGLATFRYSLCADTGIVQIRLFQDSNRNKILNTGEKIGRHDGTSDGDATYISKTISAASTNNELTGVDVVIDNTF